MILWILVNYSSVERQSNLASFWEYKLHFDEFLNQNPTLLHPVGGMDAIVKAFEKRVGSLIRYHSVVEEIRKTPPPMEFALSTDRPRRVQWM